MYCKFKAGYGMKCLMNGQIPRQGNPFAADPGFKDDSNVNNDQIQKIMQELEEMDRKKYVAFKSYSEMSGEK